MKKLICAKEVEEAALKGEHTIVIEKSTIITPAARDTAKNFHVEFVSECDKPQTKPSCPQIESKSDIDIDPALIFKVLQAMADRGMLESLMGMIQSAPFESESDESGFKLIRGNTVKLEKKEENDRVMYREIIGQKDAPMSVGMLTMEDTTYEAHYDSEIMVTVLEGSPTVTLNGKTFGANPQDMMVIPKGAHIKWGSTGKTKLICARKN